MKSEQPLKPERDMPAEQLDERIRAEVDKIFENPTPAIKGLIRREVEAILRP